MPASRRGSLQSDASIGTAEYTDLITTETLALPKTPPTSKTKETVDAGGTTIPLPAMGKQGREVATDSITYANPVQLKDGFAPKTEDKGSKTFNASGKPTKIQVDELWNLIRQEAIDAVLDQAKKDSQSSVGSMVIQDQYLQFDEETLRGITQRPSGAWQAQIYYAGKTRYIGCFDSKIVAAQVYQYLRERLKKNKRQKANAASSFKKKRPVAKATSTSHEAPNTSPAPTTSLPPFKKRKSLPGANIGEANRPLAENAAFATSHDNAYHSQASTAPTPAALYASNTHNQAQGVAQRAATMTASRTFSSRGGSNCAPLAPSPYMPNQHHHEPRALVQQQWVHQMMPPPPPQPHFNAHGFTGTVANAWLPSHATIAVASQMHSNHGVYHGPPSNVPPSAGTTAQFAPKPKKAFTSIRSANKNPEDEKKWKDVRREVLEFIKSNPQSTNTSNISMDKELLRGITMRPSGKFQAQMYFSGQSRYIGVFDTKEQAALAYEMIRNRIKPPQVVVVEGDVTLPVFTPKPKGERANMSNRTRASLPVMNVRAITPSPTTVAFKQGHVAASTPPYMRGRAAASSPLASLTANARSHEQPQMPPTMHFGLSIGHYVPSGVQPRKS
jgi:hypothetical protein